MHDHENPDAPTDQTDRGSAGVSPDPAGDQRFLARLTAADPIDPVTLPTAGDPEAARLLDDIVAADVTIEDAPSTATYPLPVRAGTATAGETGPSRLGLLARSRSALVAVAAAVLLLVGAVTVLSPDNTPAAVAEVRAAAATTADADTGRITSTFQLTYDDAELSDAAGGTVEVTYVGGDLGLSVDVDQVPDELGSEADEFLPALDDIRLVDDVAYVQQGGTWIAIDTGGLLGDIVVDLVDPRTVLDTVQELTEATEVGPAEIDGVATTQYRSVIDLGDETLGQSGWLAFDGMDVDADGEIAVDLYVSDGDDGEILRRFDLTGDIQAPEGEDGSATFEIVTLFTDLGADLTIEAPDGAVAFDPLADAFDTDAFEDETDG